MSSNGHDPAVTHLGEIIDRSEPVRIVRMPTERLDPRSLHQYELEDIGRTLGFTPSELVTAISAGDWDAFTINKAIAWQILRREEPDLAWAEARRFDLEPEPPSDPTPPVNAGASPSPGIAGSSIPPLRQASRSRKSDR